MKGRFVRKPSVLMRTCGSVADSSSEITARPQPTEEEIQFILDAIAEYLTVEVRRCDVQSAWSGLRPLAVDPNAKDTASVSRDHIVTTDPDGLITVTGARRMLGLRCTSLNRVSLSSLARWVVAKPALVLCCRCRNDNVLGTSKCSYPCGGCWFHALPAISRSKRLAGSDECDGRPDMDVREMMGICDSCFMVLQPRNAVHTGKPRPGCKPMRMC